MACICFEFVDSLIDERNVFLSLKERFLFFFLSRKRRSRRWITKLFEISFVCMFVCISSLGVTTKMGKMYRLEETIEVNENETLEVKEVVYVYEGWR